MKHGSMSHALKKKRLHFQMAGEKIMFALLAFLGHLYGYDQTELEHNSLVFPDTFTF